MKNPDDWFGNEARLNHRFAIYLPSCEKGGNRSMDSSDAFRYVYQNISGDGSITTRVGALQDTGTDARVGIMMRDTLATNARMGALTVTGSGAWRWQRRTLTGSSVSTTNSSSGTAPNLWVRLVRSGSTITAYRSTNGTTWSAIGNASVTMSSTCYIGLAVASGSTSTLNTSVMDKIMVTPASPLLNPDSDTDADGLTYSWESLYYSSELYGSSDDPDADGQSNHNELVAGTNPLDRDDATRLHIVSVSPAMFEFDGKADRTYALERLDHTGGTQWTAVQLIGPLLSDGTTQVIDPAASEDRGIYRLQIVLPVSP